VCGVSLQEREGKSFTMVKPLGTISHAFDALETGEIPIETKIVCFTMELCNNHAMREVVGPVSI
jgi:hypothetical protein